MSTSTLYINTSNNIDITGIKNPLIVEPNDPYLNSASVSITILDSAGAELAGETWPQALAYVADSDGIYREPFAPFTALKDGETYTIKYNIVDVTGLKLETSKNVKAEKSASC